MKSSYPTTYGAIGIHYNLKEINPFVALILARRHKRSKKSITYYRYGTQVFTVENYYDEDESYIKINKTEIQEITRDDLQNEFNNGFILP